MAATKKTVARHASRNRMRPMNTNSATTKVPAFQRRASAIKELQIGVQACEIVLLEFANLLLYLLDYGAQHCWQSPIASWAADWKGGESSHLRTLSMGPPFQGNSCCSRFRGLPTGRWESATVPGIGHQNQNTVTPPASAVKGSLYRSKVRGDSQSGDTVCKTVASYNGSGMVC